MLELRGRVRFGKGIVGGRLGVFVGFLFCAVWSWWFPGIEGNVNLRKKYMVNFSRMRIPNYVFPRDVAMMLLEGLIMVSKVLSEQMPRLDRSRSMKNLSSL